MRAREIRFEPLPAHALLTCFAMMTAWHQGLRCPYAC
jgi:hypothetical protein